MKYYSTHVFVLCLYLHTERHQLKPNDHPLAVRVLKGPCEQVSKIFLMELDQVEDVTYDVSEQMSQLVQSEHFTKSYIWCNDAMLS